MIAIVTDSTAYLTREEAAQLGVVMVPMSYTVGEEQSVSEGFIEDSDDAERLVAKHIATMHTSQATLPAFTNAFARLRKAGYDILCVTISSRLSGTYANAVLAAREMDGHHIAVVDSLSVAGGLYLLIREAREVIHAGAQLFETARHLEALRERVHTAFSVDDMEPLRRSGRLGNVRLSISTILNIRPILTVTDGSIVSCGVARGRVEQMKKLRQFVKQAKGELIVERFLADDEAAQLTAQLESAGYRVQQRRVGPVLGAHLGTGSVGVGWLEA